MDSDLPRNVQMQFMRPAQLERALRTFPVVYVPFGLIEWHGRHLPFGNDTLKAHAFLVKCAERHGGVVYPPIYFPSATFTGSDDGQLAEEDLEYKVPMLTALFERLRATGFRVIIGVSGHDIPEQLEMIRKGLGPVTADGAVAGAALFEVAPDGSDECGMDHAAKWETSSMMLFYPDLVDMAALGDGPLAPDMQPPDGIGGLDPREHASAEAGRSNAEAGVENIARTARELLDSLPEELRSSSLEAVSPEHWWSV